MTNAVQGLMPVLHTTTQTPVPALVNATDVNATASHASKPQMPQLHKEADAAVSHLSHHALPRFPINEDALQTPVSKQSHVPFSGQNLSPPLTNGPSTSNPPDPSYSQPSIPTGTFSRSTSRNVQQVDPHPTETNHTRPSTIANQLQTAPGYNLSPKEAAEPKYIDSGLHSVRAAQAGSPNNVSADAKPPTGFKKTIRMPDPPAPEATTLQGVTASLEVKYQVGTGSQGRKNLVTLCNRTDELEHPVISNAKDVKQPASSGYNTSRQATSTNVDSSTVSNPHGTPEQSVPASILPMSPLFSSSIMPVSSRGYDRAQVQAGASDDQSPCRPVLETVSQLPAPQAPRAPSIEPNLANTAHPRVVTRENSRGAIQGTPYPTSRSKPVPANGSTPESSKAKTDSLPLVTASTSPQSALCQPKTLAEVHSTRTATPQGRHPLNHVAQGVCPLS
jgi:hypothetical protein